jgi:hypothetical protein
MRGRERKGAVSESEEKFRQFAKDAADRAEQVLMFVFAKAASPADAGILLCSSISGLEALIAHDTGQPQTDDSRSLHDFLIRYIMMRREEMAAEFKSAGGDSGRQAN